MKSVFGSKGKSLEVGDKVRFNPPAVGTESGLWEIAEVRENSELRLKNAGGMIFPQLVKANQIFKTDEEFSKPDMKSDNRFLRAITGPIAGAPQ